MILELEKVLRKTYLSQHESEFKAGFYYALKLVWTYMNKYKDVVNIHMENKALNLENDDLAHWKAEAIKREEKREIFVKHLSDVLKNRNVEISELKQKINNSRVVKYQNKYKKHK